MRRSVLAFVLATVVAAAVQAAPAASPAASASAADSHRLDDATVLKKEPAAGRLRPGQRVLVDDGSCPAGTIKELTGGSNRKCSQEAELLDPHECRMRVTGNLRSSKCVERR